MMRFVIVAGVVAGCQLPGKQVGPFVRSVSVRGSTLVMEHCTIEIRGDNVGVGHCTFAHSELPVTALLPPTPGYAQITAQITPEMTAGVRACAARHAVTGTLDVIIHVNYAGRLVGVQPKTGTRALADCTGSALSAASFPRSRQGATTTIAFQLETPAPH